MEMERKHFLEGKQMEEESKNRPERRLLTIPETGVYLGLSARTIYNGIAPKSKSPFPVKPKRIGKSVRFDLRDLEKYVDALDR